MKFAITQLEAQPGRRVLVTLSSGLDSGSTATWKEIKDLAQFTSAAVLGVYPQSAMVPITQSGFHGAGQVRRLSRLPGQAEDPFETICELSGGLLQPGSGNRKLETEQLQRLIEMMRQRYILEYPRASNVTPGFHALAVSVTDSDAYVRPAGVAAALPDPLDQGHPANAPVQGTRRILVPKQP